VTARATAAVEDLASQHSGGLVVVGSHGTFVTAVLAGFGCEVGWPFCRDMPMPAIYRLQLDRDRRAVAISGPGLPGQRPVG
jgi:2,3-bisphosphoglycerate-dependent phosphoglycerate mutase